MSTNNHTEAFDRLHDVLHNQFPDENLEGVDQLVAASFFEFRKYPTNIHLNEEEVGVAYTDCPVCEDPSFSAAGFCLFCGFAAGDEIMIDTDIQNLALLPEPQIDHTDYRWTRWNFLQSLNNTLDCKNIKN